MFCPPWREPPDLARRPLVDRPSNSSAQATVSYPARLVDKDSELCGLRQRCRIKGRKRPTWTRDSAQVRDACTASAATHHISERVPMPRADSIDQGLEGEDVFEQNLILRFPRW